MESKLRNIINALGIFLILLFSFFVIKGNGAPFLTLVAAGVCFIFGNIDKIKRFKASTTGIEAETYEIVKEAKHTINELKIIGKALSEVLLLTVHSAGRFGGTSEEFKENIKNKISTSLSEIGLMEKDISDVLEAEFPFVCFDYVCNITSSLHSILSEEQKKTWGIFFKEMHKKGIGYEPKPGPLEAFINSNGLMTVEIKGHLDDYRYYIKEKKHRDPNSWKNRINWNRKTDKN